MSKTLTLNLGGGSTMPVTPQQTETPGLLVHDIPFFDDRTRLVHHSGLLLGIFQQRNWALEAAASMARLIDWASDTAVVRDGGRQLIWRTADAIEEAGGSFECSPSGLAAQVMACRDNGCLTPWEGGCEH